MLKSHEILVSTELGLCLPCLHGSLEASMKLLPQTAQFLQSAGSDRDKNHKAQATVRILDTSTIPGGERLTEDKVCF